MLEGKLIDALTDAIPGAFIFFFFFLAILTAPFTTFTTLHHTGE